MSELVRFPTMLDMTPTCQYRGFMHRMLLPCEIGCECRNRTDLLSLWNLAGTTSSLTRDLKIGATLVFKPLGIRNIPVSKRPFSVRALHWKICRRTGVKPAFATIGFASYRLDFIKLVGDYNIIFKTHEVELPFEHTMWFFKLIGLTNLLRTWWPHSFSSWLD